MKIVVICMVLVLLSQTVSATGGSGTAEYLMPISNDAANFGRKQNIEAEFKDEQVQRLVAAAADGNLAIVKEMLELGVDVNSRGETGDTPLAWAMSNVDGFSALLEAGANPNAIVDGSSVIHVAAMYCRPDLLSILFAHEGNPNLIAGQMGVSPLLAAVNSAQCDPRPAMRVLINAGADISYQPQQEIFGETRILDAPVMAAAAIGDYKIVWFLMQCGSMSTLSDQQRRNLWERARSHKGKFPSDTSDEKWRQKVEVELEHQLAENASRDTVSTCSSDEDFGSST